MRNARTHVAQTAAFVRPLTRSADWSCMPVMAWGLDVGLEVALIRKTRV